MASASDNPPIERLDAVDSTNLEARRRIEAGLVGPIVIVAATQTGGIGRLGRPWQSPRGGLWMTVVRPVREPDPFMAMRVSHGVWARLRALGLADARLKWPNDVHVGHAKVAGVLVEMTSSWAIIGIGINANFDAGALAPVLRSSATTLQHELSRAVDLDALERQIVGDVIGLECASALVIEPEAVWGLGAHVEVTMADGSQRRGTVSGIGTDGSLVVSSDGVEWSVPVEGVVDWTAD